jgi:hypothetical protein
MRESLRSAETVPAGEIEARIYLPASNSNLEMEMTACSLGVSRRAYTPDRLARRNPLAQTWQRGFAEM